MSSNMRSVSYPKNQFTATSWYSE